MLLHCCVRSTQRMAGKAVLRLLILGGLHSVSSHCAFQDEPVAHLSQSGEIAFRTLVRRAEPQYVGATHAPQSSRRLSTAVHAVSEHRVGPSITVHSYPIFDDNYGAILRPYWPGGGC